jgi:hypothetical protein
VAAPRSLALLPLAALAACTDDTALLVEVHGEALPAAVATLETIVLPGDAADEPSAQQWGDALRVPAAVAAPGLRARPFTVLVRPDGLAGGGPVWVSALAYDEDGGVVGWGTLPAAEAFIDGAVKRVRLDLAPVAGVVGGGCVVREGEVVWAVDDDCDDDAVAAAADCDDLDAQVGADLDGDPVACADDCDFTSPAAPVTYPGAPERCDGLDNDCDPATAPGPRLCSVLDPVIGGTPCRLGVAACEGVPEPAQYGDCRVAPLVNDTTTDVLAPLCERWSACDVGTPDVQDPACFVDALLRCAVPTTVDGAACAPATYRLDQLAGVSSCSWRMLDGLEDGSWYLGLRPRNLPDAPLATSSADCDTELVVKAAGTLPRLVTVVMQPGGLEPVRVAALLLRPSVDDCQPGSGSELRCEEDFTW